ncbi:lipopolysaccharide biosynthesis protein [Leptolyngbya sp. FACHB-261]|nr:lipopolysaccharide biosynthesis protein [Leptolyngbya sp. FACHB-261]
MLVDKIGVKLKQQLRSKFIRNLGWLGGSEIAIRLVRLAVTVILARFLTPYDYGLGAVVLAVREFTQVFTRIGIGAKIVQADSEDLERLCNAGYWLNWVVFCGLFVGQCLVAFPVAWFYHDSKLILPICVSALVYLLTPMAAVQAALIHRENRLEIAALAKTLQNSSNYVLSALLACLGLGMWAIVLPGVLVAPVWVWVYYSHHSWQPTSGLTTKDWPEIFSFGRNILGVELLKALRNNLDYLIVGRFIGIAELGIYYFAFNAGLGISLSIISALNSALLPHLCAARSNWLEFRKRYWSSLKIIACIIVPLVVLQSSLASFYVPTVFGKEWTAAIPILIIICLSAIPRPFAEAASQLLTAVGKPNLDLRWNVLFTTIFAIGLLIGVRWQAWGVATSVLLTHAIFLPLFVIWATNHVFHSSKLLTSNV